MSVDLFVVRDKDLSWSEIRNACDELARACEGVTFWSMVEKDEATSAYFWKVERVTLAFVAPEKEDIDEDDPPELTKPFAVVASRSGAWAWIEWTALELARRLDARVFDPQEGALLASDAKAEHDLAALKRMHDEYLRDKKPSLRASYWAFEPDKGIARDVQAFERAAREVLGVEQRFELPDEQVNLWETFELPNGGQLRISTMTDSGQRSLHVGGPSGDPVVAKFAAAVAKETGVTFRHVDEYA